MSVKLLTEHLLEFLSLKRGCTGSSESTLGKMLHCWKSQVVGLFLLPGIYTETIKLCPLDVYVCQFLMYVRISFIFFTLQTGII